MEEEREPFDVGRKACLDGVFDNADPYPPGSPEAKEWSEGWFAALTVQVRRLALMPEGSRCICPTNFRYGDT